MTTRSRMGRPPLFDDPVRVLIFLERRERARLQKHAREQKLSLSAWARRVLLAQLPDTGRKGRP